MNFAVTVITQVGIVGFGATAIYLTNSREFSVRRWACVFGLLAQPFWFWSTYAAAQWGIFAVSFWYAYSWARGFYFNWVNPPVAGINWEARARVAEATLANIVTRPERFPVAVSVESGTATLHYSDGLQFKTTSNIAVRLPTRCGR